MSGVLLIAGAAAVVVVTTAVAIATHDNLWVWYAIYKLG